MPNRILKESICTSDSIDHLSLYEESFFYRLVVNADDFGRYDARPAILRARLFPLKRYSDEDMLAGLHALEKAGIIALYTVEGKPYLYFTQWKKHQTIRNAKSKYPEPPARDEAAGSAVCAQADVVQTAGEEQPIRKEEADCTQLNAIEINRTQANAADCNCARNPIQSNPNTNPNPNTNTNPKDCTEVESSQIDSATVSQTDCVSLCVFGRNRNVSLTAEQYEQLKRDIVNLDKLIDSLSEYMLSSGKSYNDHAATLRIWAARNGQLASRQKGRHMPESHRKASLPPVSEDDIADAYYTEAELLEFLAGG